MENLCHLCNKELCQGWEISLMAKGNRIKLCKECADKIAPNTIATLPLDRTLKLLEEHCDGMEEDLTEYLSECYDISFYTKKLIVGKVYYDRLHTHRQLLENVRKQRLEREAAE